MVAKLNAAGRQSSVLALGSMLFHQSLYETATRVSFSHRPLKVRSALSALNLFLAASSKASALHSG